MKIIADSFCGDKIMVNRLKSNNPLCLRPVLTVDGDYFIFPSGDRIRHGFVNYFTVGESELRVKLIQQVHPNEKMIQSILLADPIELLMLEKGINNSWIGESIDIVGRKETFIQRLGLCLIR